MGVWYDVLAYGNGYSAFSNNSLSKSDSFGYLPYGPRGASSERRKERKAEKNKWGTLALGAEGEAGYILGGSLDLGTYYNIHKGEGGLYGGGGGGATTTPDIGAAAGFKYYFEPEYLEGDTMEIDVNVIYGSGQLYFKTPVTWRFWNWTPTGFGVSGSPWPGYGGGVFYTKTESSSFGEIWDWLEDIRSSDQPEYRETYPPGCP